MSSLQTKTAYLVRQPAVQYPAIEAPVTREKRESGTLTARLAIDNQTRSDAFALRHAAYVAAGYLDPISDGLFSDPYDDMPNCSTIVIYKDGRPAASVRLAVLDSDPDRIGWHDVPAAHIFHDEVATLLAPSGSGQPKRAAEITRLVRHPDFATDSELVFVLFRFVPFLLCKQKIDMVLSCVRRNHVPFYKRLEFDAIAGPKSYPGLKFAVNLMVCPQSKYATIFKKIPLLNSTVSGTSGYDGLFQGETVAV
jgi:hypothetical protein